MVTTSVGFKSLNFRHFWRITVVLRVKRGRRRPFLELSPCHVMMFLVIIHNTHLLNEVIYYQPRTALHHASQTGEPGSLVS